MQKADKKEIFLLAIVCTILIFGGLALIYCPAPRFSESENRLLADRPCFTWGALKEGSYTAAWERYAAERMIARRAMRGVHAATELALGKCEVSNVLLCRDGSLANRLNVNERIYQKNLTAIAKLNTKVRKGAYGCHCASPYRCAHRCTSLPLSKKRKQYTLP